MEITFRKIGSQIVFKEAVADISNSDDKSKGYGFVQWMKMNSLEFSNAQNMSW